MESHRYEVFAYHFPFPGRGHLKREGDQYTWLPSQLELTLPNGVVRGFPSDSPLRAHSSSAKNTSALS